MADIFVFGSNLAGRHGKGAAKWAMDNRGSKYGQGEGLQGESYEIANKDEWMRVRGLVEIEKSVSRFIEFAAKNKQHTFEITPIGCGLAGYSPVQIKPMFEHMPSNCRFSEGWRDHERMSAPEPK